MYTWTSAACHTDIYQSAEDIGKMLGVFF